MFKRLLKLCVIALALFVVVAQAFRMDKTNPPVTADLSAPAPVKEIMKRACYDCHSNETVWPWYSDVAPLSWLLAYDVHEGRAELNFSDWGTYRVARRLKELEKIRREVTDGEMPPWYYVYPMRPDRRLSTTDREALFAWITLESASPEQGAH